MPVVAARAGEHGAHDGGHQRTDHDDATSRCRAPTRSGWPRLWPQAIACRHMPTDKISKFKQFEAHHLGSAPVLDFGTSVVATVLPSAGTWRAPMPPRCSAPTAAARQATRVRRSAVSRSPGNACHAIAQSRRFRACRGAARLGDDPAVVLRSYAKNIPDKSMSDVLGALASGLLTS